jgi:hypothetical protein
MDLDTFKPTFLIQIEGRTLSADITPERTSLGRRTCLVDGNTGEARYKEQESGQIVPSFERSEGFHEEPRQEPAQDLAEGRFKEARWRPLPLEPRDPRSWSGTRVSWRSPGSRSPSSPRRQAGGREPGTASVKSLDPICH